MNRIIDHLRNFTRKSTEDFQMVDVHSVIEESLKLLDRQLVVRGIKIERKFSIALPLIYCNPFQLEQVFINLATNARDAIEAKKTNSGKMTIQTSLSKDTQFIEIQFSDDGVGIPDQTKAKVFNPFFTTKEVGKGMGLGLSISYGILSRINASILVESAAGRGTTFTIKLPVDFRKH
jgi:C4-dicarboxylate-specific signal transduction histidine kinase